MEVKFNQVSKKFGKVVALENLDFTIKQGDFVFITGPSGSGKTTILKLITGSYLPDEGEVLIDDKPTRKMKKGEILGIRRNVGMVFQEFKLIPEMNVFENVAIAYEVVGKKNSSKIKEAVFDSLIEVGLEGREDAFPLQLSGGELQRVCLARALAIDPQIVIADEPTGNLDPVTSWDLMKLLVKINKEGKTVIMATHDFDIVNSFKKRVIKIESGKLVKDKKRGKY
jgi:cell division transport system ATP-binding protein